MIRSTSAHTTKVRTPQRGLEVLGGSSRAVRMSTEGEVMADCSARPDKLATFATASSLLDVDPAEKHLALQLALASFNRNNHWGSLDAGGLVDDLRQFLDANATDAAWVAAVGEAFRAADAEGDVAYATTADVQSRIRTRGVASTGRADIQVEL